MRILCEPDYYNMCRAAANIISAQLILKPACVLGLATGGTPLGIYKQLIDWYRKGDLDFSECSAVNLDEYCGLSPQDEHSYAYYMDENLFRHINIDKSRTFIPNGMNANAAEECARYDKLIEKLGGIDLQLLGIGHNGHIGFNEPDSQLPGATNCVELTQSTIEANERFFERKEDVPTRAYTMGLKGIMGAERIVLAVSGESKADIIYQTVLGPIETSVPSSILQLHNDVTVVGDRAALGKLLEKAPELVKQPMYAGRK